MSLRFSLIAASAVLAFAATSAFASPQAASTAAAPTKTLTSSQQHMAECSTQAKGKKGADYKSAVSACMKGETAAAPAAKQTQQEKMKSCNVDAKAKALKGDERKSFMKDCLSNHP